jgi:hypothetical protein
LNSSAAAVWSACDGRRDPDQIARHTGLELGIVELALDSLARSLLLIGTVPPLGDRVSRRQVLRHAALTGASLGVAIPIVRSIAAPSAAMAASAGSSCTRDSDCGAASVCHSNGAAPSGICSPGSSCASYTGSVYMPCSIHPCCVGQVCHSTYSSGSSLYLTTCEPRT